MLRYGIVVSPARGSEDEERQDPGAEERKGGERAHQRPGAHRPEAPPIVRKLLVRVAPGKVQEMSSTQVRESEESPWHLWLGSDGEEAGRSTWLMPIYISM